MSIQEAPQSTYDVEQIRNALQTDGVIALKGAFSREWAAAMREDVEAEFAKARQRVGGAIGRGPQRWYVEMHPEAFRGFLDLVTHPWVELVSSTMLGPDYRIVEIGFDIPFPGAKHQPWHRDFRTTPEMVEDHKFSSLAFNLTCVDTLEEMGPFEIAPGTQYESGDGFDHGMFPPESEFPRYAALGVKKYPQLGDISARSALTIHRGTANLSTDLSRPVLVLGVDAPGAGHEALHDLQVTQAFWDTVPERTKPHLACRVVEELEPIVQKHDIEGLVMGAAE
ncbi:MAG: phytanoyl-CoA dioxygenase [Frankiales bacterium]|nr:phytanoyl-CoA dioxygenase [Frankiales bacterium]